MIHNGLLVVCVGKVLFTFSDIMLNLLLFNCLFQLQVFLLVGGPQGRKVGILVTCQIFSLAIFVCFAACFFSQCVVKGVVVLGSVVNIVCFVCWLSSWVGN